MLMKFVASKRLVHSFYLGLACLLILQCPCFGYSENERGTQQYQYLALPLTNSVQNSQDHKTLDRYGIPFLDGSGLPSDRPAQVDVGGTVKRIFLRGMFLSADLRAWADPRDYSVRFFVGDELGQIRLNYDDGSTQIFPMILGESVWWGPLFYQYQEPFPTDTRLRNALAAAMHLYPPAPVEDGNYVAVITPKPLPIRSMTIENSTKKKSTVMISGITVESAESNKIAGAISLPAGTPSAQFEQFVREKSLRLLGEHENEALRRLTAIRQALYTSNENFLGHVSKETPPDIPAPMSHLREIPLRLFWKMPSDTTSRISGIRLTKTGPITHPPKARCPGEAADSEPSAKTQECTTPRRGHATWDAASKN